MKKLYAKFVGWIALAILALVGETWAAGKVGEFFGTRLVESWFAIDEAKGGEA